MLQAEYSVPPTSAVSDNGILTPNARRMEMNRERKKAENPSKIPKGAAQRAREYRQRKEALL